MLGVNRIGFTELSNSVVAGDHSQGAKKVKYGELVDLRNAHTDSWQHYPRTRLEGTSV